MNIIVSNLRLFVPLIIIDELDLIFFL